MLDFGYYNMDCTAGMKEFPDKYFDLAVVDPPYFSGPERRKFYGRKISPIGVQRIYHQSKEWEVPGKEYFEEYLKIKLYGDAIILITYFRLAVLCGISATGKAVFQIVK